MTSDETDPVGIAALPVGAVMLERTFDDPTVTTSDQFATSVALDGERVLIGARLDDTLSGNVGQVHLFDAVTGALLRTFEDPTLRGGDEFATSVALDGERVLVGAANDDTQGLAVGEAHLFDAVTGNLLQTFDDPTVTDRDGFGTAVAIEGDRVLIGAPGDDTTGDGIGQVHLFDAVTGALLLTFDDPTATFRDFFGRSVAMSGERVLIGAFGDSGVGSTGQAHLFDTVTGALLRTFDDPTPTSFDQFGWSVALDGNRALIGARLDDTQGNDVGQAHLFDTTSGDVLATLDDPTVTGSDQFAAALALDGDRILIGASRDDTQGTDVGQAHLFEITVNAPSAAMNDAASAPAGGSVLIDVLANDSGLSSLAQAGAAAGRAPANGTVAVEGDAVRYTPDPGFAGIDIFAYEVGDGAGGTDTALVSVRVGTPEAPVGNTRGTDQDDALLIAQGSTYLGGAGDDLYLLSRAAEANAVSVIGGQAGDTLQLIEGLEIASFVLTSGAIQVDLTNGAQVQVLGADAMAFDVGGNVSTGDPGTVTDFAGFAEQVLGIAPPDSGFVSGGFLTVTEDVF